ncbi:MAG TPA: EAL domain-containing protein [Thermomicrobiales bacterium]|nr:EAL domain-containing protein [Thermomicrobiales bacterium]
MPARTLFHRPGREGRDDAPPMTERVLRASRELIAPTLNSELPAWDRFSPLLLLAMLSTVPLVAVTSGTGSLFVAWLAVAYLLSGYLWVDHAVARADGSHYWRAYVVAGSGLWAIALRLPASAGTTLTAIMGLASAGAIVAAVRLHQPTRREPWYLLAAALALTELGHAGAAISIIRDGTTPAAAGLVSLPGMALLPVALWWLLYRRLRDSSRLVLLDSAIVAAGLALLGWIAIAAPAVSDLAPSSIGLAVQLGWPLAGLAPLILTTRFLLTRWPDDLPARQLIGAGTILLLAAIAASTASASGADAWSQHPALSLLWFPAMLAFGAAALHPSMTRLAVAIHDQPAELTWQRWLLLTLALLMSPVGLLVQLQRTDEPVVVVLSGCGLVLGILYACRLAAVQRARVTSGAAARQLRLAANDLVVGGSQDDIIATTLAAARAIGGDGVTTWLYLCDGTPGELICSGDPASGHSASRLIRERDLPRSARRVLAAGTSAMLRPDEISGLRAQLGLPGDVAVVSIAPLCGNTELRGLLVSAGNRLTPDAARSQETLASLLALALDRLRLASELGYQPERVAVRARAADGTAFTFVDVDPADAASDEAVDDDPPVTTSLREAIENDELIARYQPRLDLVSGRITSVEMTAAWDSPLLGPIPRGALSAIAAEDGLSQPLRLAMLLRGCREAAGWQAAYPDRELEIVVPLDLAEAEAAGLAEDVGLALDETCCDPTRLVLQFTAATLLEASQPARNELTSIAAIGVQIAVGDAGASWSQLDQLSAIPISVIELEAAIVQRLESDQRAASIAGHLIARAHYDGARVVGHGVGRRDDWLRLRKLGCDLGQGNLFSAPLNADELATLLNRAKERAATA